jgi:SrtB family sortase
MSALLILMKGILQNMKENTEKQTKYKQKNFLKVIYMLFVLAFIGSIGYIIYYVIDINKNTGTEILNNIEVNKDEIIEYKTERMLQLEELQKENNEIIGWLEIEDTNINYPVLQTDNNSYYLTHTYKKQYSSTGSLFLDKDFDSVNGSSNYLIYGHRSKKGIMFEDLMKYAKKDFYQNHTKIKFTTNQEESTYEVLSVFYSRVYYKNEKNVFRYYYFVNAQNEQEYNTFVNSAKKASIYDTGVTAKFGDQLMTLSTCEYSQKDGRFVIVLKKQT